MFGQGQQQPQPVLARELTAGTTALERRLGQVNANTIRLLTASLNRPPDCMLRLAKLLPLRWARQPPSGLRGAVIRRKPENLINSPSHEHLETFRVPSG